MENKNTNINYLFGLLLIAAIALLYGHALWNPPVFDDKPFFVEANLARYGSLLFHLDLRWFSYASFGWTYKLFGLDWFWYRIGNLGLHALTSILLFVFFSRLLAVTAQPQGAAQSQDTALQPGLPAFLAALIFALHPVAVYGVAYLVERSIIMATLFGIASLLCYLEGLTRDGKKWFVWSGIFYFLAVFSKEHSIMIPGVAAALTLLLHKPSVSLFRKLWLPITLYAGIGLLIILRTKGLLGAPYEPFAAEMLERMSENQQGASIENAYALSVITEGYLFFKYLLLWFVPYTGWMSVDLRQTFAASITSMPELIGFILFFAYPILAARFLLKGGRRGLLGFGLLFPWILFLTEMASVRIQEPFVLYRSYLWMSGLPLVLLVLIDAVPRKIAPALLAVLCLVAATLAWDRLDTFSSDLKLWSDVVAKNTNERLLGVERGYNNRGFARMEAGNVQEGMADFNKSIAINPKYAEGYFNIGVVNFKQKNMDEALKNYNTAITLKPKYTEAYLNRGTALLQMGRHADAIEDFEHVIRINPEYAEAYVSRGMIYSKLGKIKEAISDLDEAIQINPKLGIAYMNRGIVDAMQGHIKPAMSDMNKAIELNPKYADSYFNRGIVYGAIGRHQEAMQDYSKAIELDPDHIDAHVNRGGLYMVAKRWPEAMAEFDRAIQLDPNQGNAYFNRGNILASQSRYEDAIKDYNKVLNLNPRHNRAMYNRGQVMFALNRKSEALSDFRKSCDAGNKDACARMQ